ncbi:SH3 domain-containing protein, partial [Streptococcus gordonii]
PELAYFDNGSSVYYDQIFEAEGHQWISYIGYSGNRLYVVIN